MLDQDAALETERTLNSAVATRPHLAVSHDRLRTAQRGHAALLRSAVPDDADDRVAWRERVASLDREVDQARRALLAEVPEARALDVPLEELAGRIQLALPEDTALLTLVLTPPSPTERDAPSTYTALVVTRADGPTFVSLGDAPTVDDAAHAYRDTLDGTRAGNYFRDAEALYQRLLAPLEATLGNRKTLFVVPAGPLDVVPLVALAKDRRFLLDLGFRVRYLGTAIELLRPEPSSGFDDVGPPLVLAPFSGDVPHALPAAANEARSLAALLGTSPRLGPEHASADVLRHARRPRILHVATHGEFEEAPRLRRDEAFVPNASRSSLLFPSLRHGLQFQDRLSAYELSQLDLHGTQLVVLSACNSAQGAPETGQSAHGLRRAFLVAGAETVLAALWRVDDGTTDSLMRDFYQRVLQQRQSRLDAIHDAMRALRACRPNPRYWAPFVLLGETDVVPGGGAPGH